MEILAGGLLLSTALAGVAAFHFYRKAEQWREQAGEALSLERLLEEKTASLKEAQTKAEEAVNARFAAEKQAELAQQRVADIETRMKDWETQKEESIRAAKAAVMEAGNAMSSKLLEDHKREQEQQKKEQEERLKSTTATLLEQVQSVTQSVQVLNSQTQDTRSRMDSVWQSLSSPGTAGQLSEIGLENTLKNMGFTAKRDYFMQYHFTDSETGRALRPDAVVFLPDDIVIVIDSKSSKFLLELGVAETEEARKAAQEALKKRMRDHVDALSRKDYSSAIFKDLQRKQGATTRILNVMYVPSEAAIAQITQADADFISRAEQKHIIIAGPASLHGLFSLAKMQIASMKQAENLEQIVASVSDLMESTITALSYADKIGANIHKAAENYNAFAKTVNGRLISRIRRLGAMGVMPAKNKALPASMDTYDIRKLAHESMIIEAEAEAETTAPVLALAEK